MIEIQARLPRGNIYLAGESIECVVTFKNSIQSPKNSVESNSIEGENLAWASVQIHCHCSVDETKVKFPNSSIKEEFATASEDTSFIPCRGERGHVVLSTKPKILFCDMRLMPGESKSFVYRDTIIGDCPPSFRGQAVRYAYKLTIGTQRVNTAIKLLRIPIRVFVLTGLSDVPYYNESEEFLVAPSNPFCQTQQKDSPLDLALQLLENATARRTPSFYNITNQNGRVVRFCLLKSAYRLGEDILGTFDFTTATVPCVQFSVTLQSEEEISDECKVRPKQSFSTLSYSKYHEFCLHLSHTQMVLPIPLTATPAFTTDIVSLRWRLHFEFVTAASINGEMLNKPSSVEESEGITWQGPANLDIQTMVWDLPIKIYATHPLQVAQGSLNQNFSTLVI